MASDKKKIKAVREHRDAKKQARRTKRANAKIRKLTEAGSIVA